MYNVHLQSLVKRDAVGWGNSKNWKPKQRISPCWVCCCIPHSKSFLLLFQADTQHILRVSFNQWKIMSKVSSSNALQKFACTGKQDLFWLAVRKASSKAAGSYGAKLTTWSGAKVRYCSFFHFQHSLRVKRVQNVVEEILVYTFCCFTFDIFSFLSGVYSGFKIIPATSTSPRFSEEAMGNCP